MATAPKNSPLDADVPAAKVLFTSEQLAEHARLLAVSHRSEILAGPNRLLSRLDENERRLGDYNLATYSVDRSRRITPASEWIVDNFYLIEEQVQMARRHFPPRYSRELPRLMGGRSAGLPRVYDIVLGFISHVDAEIETEAMSAFLSAYQLVTPLKLGELWAVPIMIRLALIENLRRITDHLNFNRHDRDRADHWVQRLELTAQSQPSQIVVIVAEMAQSDIPVSSSFVTEFYQRLSRSSASVPLARSWLEQKLAEHNLTIDQLVRAESQSQAADQVSVSHTITSLRMLSSWDWQTFVEEASIVERILRSDPAGVYRLMDFATRDNYRHAVESVARHGQLSESDVAEKAVGLAAAAAKLGADNRKAHVGYYLISEGRADLDKQALPIWPAGTLVERAVMRFPGMWYLGGIALFTLVASGWAMVEGHNLGISTRKLVAFTPIFLIALSQLAVAVVNWLSTVVTGPRLLPRLDYSEGISPESKTMVVVPTLIIDAETVDHLLETLEIHYLSNRDANLHFALLTDFPDADAEALPSDEHLRELLRSGICALNDKYESRNDALFYLFHRPRRWNASEGRWMGYERKRGKIAEFNSLLRGGSARVFSDMVGDLSMLPKVRFVITLDTDTQLPQNAARQLAATLAHPLNRPRFDPAKGTVVDGYSILQPRVGVSLPGAGRTWFTRLFSGDVGIDPYTKGISDVYQDVFEEGSFIGKGIYDVDAFVQAVGDRFPENTVLSHDLIEACFARSALVTDVELYEEYPSRYNADVKRRHRWIRGDWQICRWLMRKVPGPEVSRIVNPLSALSQWKIFDNLRRSLVPVALLLLLLGSWTLLPELAARGILLVLAIIVAPTLLTAGYEVSRKPTELPFGVHIRTLTTALGRQLAQTVLTMAFLPYDAVVSVDAIVRTLVRLFITRRRMLQWVSSWEDAKNGNLTLPRFYLTMWFAPFLAAAAAAILAIWEPWQLPFTAPLILLWIGAPFIAWRISQPIEASPTRLSKAQILFLRSVARKTWHFFEAFVTPEENGLPPDNYQEQPVERTANRTSPTNMGLSLLSSLAGRDMGYLSVDDLLNRVAEAVTSMERMERYRGHFYNWYDTRSLQPLQPLYISTVDSGNLAGHLLVLGPGLRELADHEILPARVFAGLCDTCEVLRTSLQGKNLQLEKLFRLVSDGVPATFAERLRLLRQAAELSASLGDIQPAAAKIWAQRLRRTAESELKDVTEMTASIGASEEQQAFAEKWWPPSGPTLGELAKPPTGHDGVPAARQRLRAIDDLVSRITEMAQMDFTFLYDTTRKLFSTGFNLNTRKQDNSYYDLLASEARLASYVAIAQGQVKQEHWFALSRLLVAGRGEPALASWSGSMFEYLMPLLVTPNYENTLLSETCRSAVERQIEYGRLRGVPWGISESGYNLTDSQLNYQYKAFGVPGLGLKRGLAEDLVIAPYATMMALMIAPRAACENLERLDREHRVGLYGFYEAVDYTASRVPLGQTGATVSSYMVHHQGMGFLALVSLLLDHPMQRRFMACPVLRAADLLLQERIPHATAKVLSKELEIQEAQQLQKREAESAMRIFTEPSAQPAEVHLLSNGRYNLVVSQSGGGYSRWKDIALTRWREDSTRDCWGTFIYVRDTVTRDFWSVAPQPVMQAVKKPEAIFAQGRAEFRHNHLGLDVYTEISVSPEDDVEIRRVTLTNPTHSRRSIELTGFFEVVLAGVADEAAHPAFSNLFVQTEFLSPQSAVLCTRRAKNEGENPPWLFGLFPAPSGDDGLVSCETDRSRFIGRGNSASSPAAMKTTGPLSNSAGSVLDPAVALRRTVIVPAGGEVQVIFVIGIAETRAGAEVLIEKYSSSRVATRTFELAWTHSQVTLRQLNASEAQAQLYARLASALVYAQSARRASSAMLIANHSGQDGLWRHGISGDLPIVLLVISDAANIEMVEQLVQAHAYWRVKGLAADLVILNGDDSSYRQPLHDQIIAVVTAGIEAPMMGKPGGIFPLRADQMTPVDRSLLQAVARIMLVAEAGGLAEQLDRPLPKAQMPPAFRPVRVSSRETAKMAAPRDLIHNNGLGGFTRDGREYVITLGPGQATPAPWINVIANSQFGTIVSESGSSYTWAENCHEFRLTPWRNDPVVDPVGEAFYLRDEETGQFWSPTPGPARGVTPYTVRHGFGYSVFEHAENGIYSELSLYVATDAPIKFAICKLRNQTSRPRKISVTGYWEWVLGDLRQRTLLHVQTEIDTPTGALLVRNRYQADFGNRIAFVDAADFKHSLTSDRLEFLGRNGSPEKPAALQRSRLSGRVGAGYDPASAVQVYLEIGPGEESEAIFRVGAGQNLQEVQDLIRRFRGSGTAHTALAQVWEYWGRTLGTVNVDTPDSAVNVIANGWLLYQTLCCRLWARTGFYQSGGAFGFRDQLQDVMALVHAEPALAREHLLRAASRQFVEGDVQHWWHPPAGRGVRTRVSDDYLWLPYAACRYSSCVGDTGVWDESVALLESRALREHEESNYDLPARSEQTASLYEHCVRAIEHGLRFGPHGLPLMGSGDWNDGMNLVGIEGRGESVWLAFFLCDVLRQFAEVAQARGDAAMKAKCEQNAAMLQVNIEREAWDGGWYRRAYFDNGSPLGSSSNLECQIDSLPQSWSVMSGAGEPARSKDAMQAVNDHLVRRESQLIQLFDPPFDKSTLNPGYIKGYIPGVRENGGQYTHAAVWSVMAFALGGDHDRAWELFNLLNPVRHGGEAAQIAVYKVEPYVVAADVYALPPHTGRGGWTWYTGSAGWMYRLIIETLLGVNLRGHVLHLTPRLPKAWANMKVHYRFHQTVYHITYSRWTESGSTMPAGTLDGQALPGADVPLQNDQREHWVEIPFV